MARYTPKRAGKPFADIGQESRVRELEETVTRMARRTQQSESLPRDTTGEGVAALSPAGGGGGGVSTLGGDAVGPAGSNVVERVQETDFPAPAAGDDEKFLRYQHGTPAYEFAHVPVAGDVTGDNTATVVAAIQGIPVDDADPTTGQVLQFDGAEAVWADLEGGLTLLGAWHEADISGIGTTDAEMDNSLAGATGVVLANPMPDAGELVGIAIKLTGDVDGGAGAGNDFTATVYLNGVATALLATVTGGAATEVEAVATVTPIAFAAGDDLTVFAKETGTCAAVRAVVTVWGRGLAAGGGGGGGGSESDTYANLIASTPDDGTIGLPTDSFYVLRYEGGWSHYGPLLPMATVPTSGWSWVNQETATVSATNGGIFLTGPAASGDDLRLYMRAVPAAPYVVTAAILPRLVFPANFIGCGLALRQSGTSEIMTYGLVSDTARLATQLVVSATKWSSATAFSAHYTLVPANPPASSWQMGPCLWLQIEDDNTNRILRISNDGRNFYQLFSVSRTDFLTPDEIGIVVNSNNATHTAGMQLLSWLEDT